MAKADRNKVCIVSITIQWCEANDGHTREADRNPELGIPTKSKQNTERGSRSDEFTNRSRQVHVSRTIDRLRPTDRIVLDALRAHMPENKRVTPAVRISQLVSECMISRRQVQICLRRLEGMKIIRRLTNSSSLGSQEGNRYQVSKAMFHRWIKSV